MDWIESPDIETIPGKCGGRPVIKGTRIEPDGLVTDYDLGSSIEEIHDNLPTVAADTIRRIVAFAQSHQPA
jgi:uncharacterized protein (DUF433 family)